MLVLPYKSEKGQRIIKSINKDVKEILPRNHVTQNVYRSKKLDSYFNIKIPRNKNINMTLNISHNVLE